jgi:1,4-dihydroxy-2-naphthoate polyprenyltransferase
MGAAIRGRASAWLRATRPLAHGNIAPPILLGQAWAWAATGRFSLTALVVAQAFGVIDHLFIVFANDVADLEVDRDNRTHNLFSGGARVLVEGWITRRALGRAAVAMAALLLMLCFTWRERPLLPLFGLAAIALLIAYSYPPLRLSHRGGGEVLQGLGVGVVLPLVGYYGQAGDLGELPVVGLVALFAFGVAGNVLTALPDEPSDRAGGKRSWPVLRGGRRARRDALALSCLALAVASLAMVDLAPTPRAVVLGLPALSLFASLFFLSRADPGERGCLPFVALAAGASAILQLGWSAALARSAGEAEERGALATQIAEGPIEARRGVPAPGLDGDEGAIRQIAMNGDLGTGLAREAEGVAWLRVTERRILRVALGDEREELVPTALAVTKKTLVERSDPCPLVGRTTDPLGPVEAVNEVVNVRKADRRVAAVEAMQLGRACELIADPGLARPQGSPRQHRREMIEIPEEVVREVLDDRLGEIGEPAGKAVEHRPVEALGRGAGAELGERSGPGAIGREAAPLDAVEAPIDGAEPIERAHGQRLRITSKAAMTMAPPQIARWRCAL